MEYPQNPSRHIYSFNYHGIYVSEVLTTTILVLLGYPTLCLGQGFTLLNLYPADGVNVHGITY